MLEGISDNGVYRKKWNEQALLLAVVNSKFEEGSVRAITGSSIVETSQLEQLTKHFLQCKKGTMADSWSAILAHLPDTASTTPIQVTEKEVEDAVRSFPSGASGDPNDMGPNT